MTAINLWLRISELSVIVIILLFLAQYTAYSPWWRDPVGRTIVIKDGVMLLIALPAVLSVWFNFNRFGSHAAGWVQVGALLGATVIMLWQVAVWYQVKHNDPRVHGRPISEQSAQSSNQGETVGLKEELQKVLADVTGEESKVADAVEAKAVEVKAKVVAAAEAAASKAVAEIDAAAPEVKAAVGKAVSDIVETVRAAL